MERVIQFFLRQSKALNFLFLFLVFYSLLLIPELKKEAFPNVELDIVRVTTLYPGATPLDVEKFVTTPLEKELKNVWGVKELQSVSLVGFSQVTVRLKGDLDKDEKGRVLEEIRQAVSRAEKNLPQNLPSPPEIVQVRSQNFPVVSVGVYGDLPYEEIHRYATLLEKELEKIPEVYKVVRLGYQNKEIWVDLDGKKLKKFEVGANEVYRSIFLHNFSLPGGPVKTPEGETLIRAEGEVRTPSDVEKIPVRVNDADVVVTVGDLGKVYWSFETPQIIERVNGKRGVVLMVTKSDDGDILRLSSKVREVVDRFLKEKNNPSLKISLMNDISIFVKNRLSVLLSNGYTGLILVVGVLFLFLNWVGALVSAYVLFASLLLALLFMSVQGISLNLISMFSLILVLGMLVDVTIVFGEDIWRRVQEGEGVLSAIVKTGKELTIPVINSVLTTVVAFIPMLLTTGTMGKFIRTLPVLVTFTLLVNLLLGIVLLPGYYRTLIPLNLRRGKVSSGEGGKGVYFWLRGRMEKVSLAILRRRYLFLFSFLLFSLFTVLFLKGRLPVELFPPRGIEVLLFYGKAPEGSSLKETEELFLRFETLFSSLPGEELKDIHTRIGIQQNDPNDPLTQRGSHLGMIYVYLTPEKERKRTAREILSALYPKVEEEAKKAGLKDFRFSFLRPGPPVGKPIAIRIQGEDLSLLKEVKEEVKKYLSQVPGVLNLADDFVLGKEEVVVRVDPVEVARSLLSEREVFSAIRMAYEGEPAVWIREGEDLIPVRVRIYASSGSISLLKDLTVTNGMGILVPLFPLLKIERSEGIKQIVHRDGIRTITITGDIDGKKTTSLRVNETILPYLRDMEKKYRGIRFTLTGEFEETRESLISLRNAFVLAIGLVFLLLLIQFRSYIRPWIILFTVPFGYLGVAWALYFHREPLSFVAMIGGIGLAGVVVNNGILLLETIDLEKKKGFSSLLAHARGVSLRLRPVFLTSFTTIGGVLPLVYGIGGEDKFISPAALSLGYGLLFSTILTLLFLPSLHLIVEDIGSLFRRWFPFSLKEGTTPSGEDRKEVHLVGDTDS